MCIAIYKPSDNVISKETLAQCFKANSDGAGFMYVDKKQLHVQKGFFTFDDFWEAFKPHEDKQAVIHFRIKTHGAINTENCHPFNVNNNFAFVHNGIISGFGKGEVSDTREFNEEVIKPLVAKWGNLSLFEPAIKGLIENRIGYSKLIFLDKNGNYDIFNEDKGSWDKGVWYSNSSYKIPVPVKHYSPPTMPSLPTYYNKAKNLAVQEGELMVLNSPFFDQDTKKWFARGEVFEVIDVNTDYTCNLMIDDGSRDADFAYNVPFSKLDFYHVNSEKEYYAGEDYFSNWE